MEVHTFSANGLNIAFDPKKVEFYVIPDSHLGALRDLLADGGKTADPNDPIANELRALFGSREERTICSTTNQRIESYRKVLNRFTLILTDRCTLRCRYCYEGSECNPRDRRGPRDLDPPTLRKGLEFVFSQYEAVASIMFFGGEPLMRPDLIRLGCRTARRIASERAVPIGTFGIITNGTLLTDAVVALLREEGIFVTLSCDGPQAVNDAWRVWPSGEGSYQWIDSAALRLASSGVPFGVQAALTPLHAAVRCGTREIGTVVNRWTPMVPHVVAAQISESSPNAWNRKETNWLLSMYCEEARRCLSQIETGKLDEARPFTRMLAVLQSLIWKAGSPLRCPAGTEIALSPDGRLYPCFMFANESSEYSLCEVSRPNPARFWRAVDAFIIANQKRRNAECSACWARALCSGCLGANVEKGGSIAKNDKLNCSVIRSLAETVMGWLAEVQTDPPRWNRFRENYTALCKGISTSSECP